MKHINWNMYKKWKHTPKGPKGMCMKCKLWKMVFMDESDNKPLLLFDSKLIEFRKCSIENCHIYETNQDSEGKAFCKNHWNGYAKK